MSPTLLSFRFGGASNPNIVHPPTMTDKGKEPLRDDMDLTEDFGRPVWSSHRHDIAASSSSRPSTSSGIPESVARKAQRGSIFTAASDALGLKLSLARRRPPPRVIPAPVVLPDVIEITARKRDEEEEERNRLRAEAAQAIGLVDEDVQSHHISTDDGHDELEERSMSTRHGVVHNLSDSINSGHYANGGRGTMYTPTQTHGSSTSVAATNPVGRYRSGSLIGPTHSRSNSVQLTPIPPYPTTVSSLAQWQQHAVILPKYYPPSSLRIFALSNSKNWKPRYIMLTSPTAIITRTRAPAVSYLHLFKGSGSDEKELERLVINEDSVVFVSDDEVGGRRHVIKMGGIDGGAFKKDLNVEENGRIMWYLQIEDQAESQQWIAGIKNSILNQRALRAGLLPTAGTTFGVNEPRGDIDVMLSMRAQGLITSHSNARQHHSTPPSAFTAAVHAEQNLTCASSISEHSLRSQASSPKTTVLAVSTLKGLFSGSRPRSGSRAASVDTAKLLSQQPQQQPPHEGATLDSAGVGNNLMSILRSATPDLQSQSSGATLTAASPPPIGRPSSPPFVPSVAPDTGIDRQILSFDQERQQYFSSNPDIVTNDRGAKTLSLGSMSLQPPPRKRWTSNAVVTPVALAVNASPTNRTPTPTEMYKNAQFNGTTGSLGALTYVNYNKDLPSEPGSPTGTSMMTGSMDHNHLHVNHGSNNGHHQGHVRPPSAQSTSTYATSNGGDSSSMAADRMSSRASAKRSGSSQGVRRFSRQGQGPLPPRTSPPMGPPPDPPSNPPSSTTTSPDSHSSMIIGDALVHRHISRPSSATSTHSQQSLVSSLPSFSKRTSMSSDRTTSSNSNSANGHGHGHGVGLVVRSAGHRSSMPPPSRPAPTSALPPAPGEQSPSPVHTPKNPSPNSSMNMNTRSVGRNRPHSVDSSVPNPVPKSKRTSIAGRGFRLSMIAPSKPPPSTNLPPRPDEVGEYDGNQSPPPSASSRRMSVGQSRLSRLNPIPASPDLNAGTAPFPPPKGPLPPTPEISNNNTTKLSGGMSRHTSFKQRLRNLSAPAASSTLSNQSNAGGGANPNANVNNAPSTSAPALSNISNTSTFTNNASSSPHNNTTQHHTHNRSFASRFHHSRNSSLTSNNNNPPPTPSSRLAQSPPPPLFSTPSYLNMTTTHDEISHPDTPLGEKIMSFQEESSFLNMTPISPTMPLLPPPPSPPPKLHGGHLSSMGGLNGINIPIRPLPAIPAAMPEMTSLSPPPRRNSKVVIDNTPAPVVVAPIATKPPRTPSTPSVFEDIFGAMEREERKQLPIPPPHFRSHTFGPETPPPIEKELTPANEPQKYIPLLLSLPPSPLIQPVMDEFSSTPPDTPSYESYETSHRVSPSSPASMFSLGMRSV